MTDHNENTPPVAELSDEELRSLMLRKREIEAMSREDMVAELMKIDLKLDSKTIGSMEIHPESRLAALGKSPDEMFMADLKTNPAWMNILAFVVAAVILGFMFAAN
jgi:hypothetical protein